MNTVQEKQIMKSVKGGITNEVLVMMEEICVEDDDIILKQNQRVVSQDTLTQSMKQEKQNFTVKIAINIFH